MKDQKERLTKEKEIEDELLNESEEAPYDDDIMPDDPRHGVISSKPDLFEDDETLLDPDGKVKKETDQYDEENIKEYETPE